MLLAETSASDPVGVFADIAQSLAALLSVPAVATVLTAIYWFLSPTAHLSATLKRNADLFQALPPSEQRKILGQRIDRDLAKLNAKFSEPARQVPSSDAAVAPHDATTSLPAARKRASDAATILIVVVVVAIAVVTALAFALSGSRNSLLTLGVSALIGAVVTIVFAVLAFVRDRHPRSD
jgi:hypothetical protein